MTKPSKESHSKSHHKDKEYSHLKDNLDQQKAVIKQLRDK